MTVPFLVAGLILDLAGKQWFSGAQTVGLILIVVGVVGILLQLLILAGAAAIITKR